MPGTSGCMPGGATRRATFRRTQASVISAVERLAKAPSNDLLSITIAPSVLVINHQGKRGPNQRHFLDRLGSSRTPASTADQKVDCCRCCDCRSNRCNRDED